MTFQIGDIVELSAYNNCQGMTPRSVIARVVGWEADERYYVLRAIQSSYPDDLRGEWRRYPSDIRLCALSMLEDLPGAI